MMPWKQAKMVYGGLAVAYQKENKYFFWDNIIYGTRTLIEPLVLLIFWQAVASSHQMVNVSSITIYFISSALVFRLCSSWIGEDLKNKIQTSELNRYLLTPGSTIFNFLIFELNLKRRRLLVTAPLTILLYILIFPHLSFTPHYLQLLALIISIPCGYIIFFCMRTMLSCLAFWFFSISGWEDIFNSVSPFLDGTFIPFVFFPASVATVIKLLPFRYSMGFSLELISFDLSTSEVLWSIATMLLWTGIMIIMGYIVWNKGLKRYNG